MLYGLDSQNQRIRAQRQSQAVCPLCKTRLVAKCGPIITHHWAHWSANSCDPWHSEETQWHLDWKTSFPEDSREVIFANHRADVKIHNHVIEFQHSNLSHDKIREREAFYLSIGLDVIWIFDAAQHSTSWWAEESSNRSEFYAAINSVHSMWTYPTKTSILHFGADDMLWIDQIDQSRAFGFFIQRPILLERFTKNNFAMPLTNLYKIPTGLIAQSGSIG